MGAVPVRSLFHGSNDIKGYISKLITPGFERTPGVFNCPSPIELENSRINTDPNISRDMDWSPVMGNCYRKTSGMDLIRLLWYN
jgi:hypothetical protein